MRFFKRLARWPVSSDRPTIITPRSRYCLLNLIRSGSPCKHGMQSLAQKSTSTILPRTSSAVSGPLVLIQPAASRGGNGLPTNAPPAGLGRPLCSAISVAAAATSSTSMAQNDPPEVDGAAASSLGGESVAKRQVQGERVVVEQSSRTVDFTLRAEFFH